MYLQRVHSPSGKHGEGDDLEAGGLVRLLAAAAVVEVHLVVAVLVQQHLGTNDFLNIFCVVRSNPARVKGGSFLLKK
jgi:hypothetical protein